MTISADPAAAIGRDHALSNAEAEILAHLRSLRYGVVEVQVHDGRIVQVERRERRRFDHR